MSQTPFVVGKVVHLDDGPHLMPLSKPPLSKALQRLIEAARQYRDEETYATLSALAEAARDVDVLGS